MKQILAVFSIGTLALLALSTAALAHGKSCAADDAQCTARREAKKAAFQAACGADVKNYCSNEAAEAAADKTKFWVVRKCLRINENSLQDSCKALLKQGHHHHQS